LARGSEAIELRIDGWDDDSDVKPLLHLLPPGRWIVTCRPTGEGGCSKDAAARRVARLVAAAKWGHGYVDFEFADWRCSADVRDALRRAAAERTPAGTEQEGFRLILSSHDLEGRPTDPAAILAAMTAEPEATAVKLAWRAEDIRDNLVALELLREATVPTAAICMGEVGLMSRVLARKFGAFASYCAPSAGEATAPGQLTLSDMIERFRWRTIGESTRLFGVLGYPIGHSMSPSLFNACFQRHGIDAVYLPLLVEPSGEVLASFLDGCRDRPWLDVGGFSVTLPHKEHAARWVGQRIEPSAARIGAVNTLVADGEHLRGYNTDCAAALESITMTLGCDRQDLGGLRAEVLGAGGAARAIIAGLRDCACDVTIYNRHDSRGRALADEFDCHAEPWEDRALNRDAVLLVNCTSIGMWPQVDNTPMPADRLRQDCAVLDMVYNPIQTRLLRDAKRAGCRISDGLSVFVNQAAMQFRLWTGEEADPAFMRATVEAGLNKGTLS